MRREPEPISLRFSNDARIARRESISWSAKESDMIKFRTISAQKKRFDMPPKTDSNLSLATLYALLAAILGGGSLLTWFSLCTSTASVLSPRDGSLGSFQEGILFFGFASVLARLIALGLGMKVKASFSSQGLLWLAVAGAAVSLPCVILSTSIADTAAPVILWIVGLSLAAGCGAVVLLTYWIDTVSHFARPPLQMLAIVGSFFLFVPFYFIIITLSPLLGRFVSPFLVVAGFLLLRLARRLNRPQKAPQEEESLPCRMLFNRYLGLLAAASFFFGLVGQAVRALTWASGSFASSVYASVYHEMGIFLSTLLVGYLLIHRSIVGKTTSDQTLGLACLFAVAVGIVVPGVTGRQFLPVADFALGVGLGCYQMQLYFYASFMEHRRQANPFVTLGLLYTPFELAGAAGLLAMEWLRSTSMNFSQIALVAVVVLFLLTIAALIPFYANQRKVFTEASPLAISDESNSNEAHGKKHELIFERLALTPRERDVALLLLQGRNLPYIQDTLSISEGTAKTHLLHIYRKCDVHDRQEFLDLFTNEAPQ